FVLQEDLEKLVTVQEVKVPQVGRITPVLRGSGYVTANGSRDFTLLALPARSLPSVDGWRSDFSARSPAELASLLRPAITPRLRGLDRQRSVGAAARGRIDAAAFRGLVRHERHPRRR